ncbi:uncharacterized protein At4g18490 isoform X1 [Coffea arabica]|uniref:Uncharacterized protein At4g18490 isoform X1 n=1 Tax=Coffea arabica TaxID=13443 RepID=A0ABM4WFI6_COFAR
MVESQKEDSSSVNSKQKKSLLDLDFGKDDFLTSWKSTSITEDDSMNLDFGPVSKGKKNAFNFAKMDVDFNLDVDFGKLPSFNLDIPDIDISSPVKKDGKSKGRSNEESASGNTQGKADRSEFTFDFGELDGFNFKPSSKKDDPKVNKGENEEDSLNRRDSQKSGDCLAEDLDAHADRKFSNLPASGDLITSNLDSDVGSGASPDTLNENFLSESGTHDDGFPNSKAAIDEVASPEEMATLKKTTSTSEKESNCQLDKSASPITDQTIQHEAVDTVLRSESGQDTLLKTQEEVSPRDASVSNQHIASFEKDNGESEVCTNNHAHIANKEGAEPALGGTYVEPILSTDASKDSITHSQMNVKNKDSLEHSTSSLESRATNNNMMPEKEREVVIRSKYFKQRDNADSRFENASHQTKLSSVHGRLIGTGEPCPPDESRNCNSIESKIDNMVAGVSPSSSEVLTRKEHSHIGSQENSKCLNTNRLLDQEVNKRIPSSRGGEKNVKTLDSFSLRVKPSSGMTKKPESQNSANPASLAVNLETSQIRKDAAAEGDKVSSSKAIKQMPALSTLTIKSTSQSPAKAASLPMNVEASHSTKGIATEGDKVSSSNAIKQMATSSGLTILRTSGANLGSSKSAAQKGIAVSGDMRQNRFLAGSTPSQTPKVVEMKNQAPAIPSLKRKIAEASSADVILNPSKRLSASPSNEDSAEIGKLVDGEVRGNGNVSDGKSMTVYKNPQTSRVDVPGDMSGLDATFSVESEINIEKADACAKGLEDICNMLRKKHEEAKEILVRAIVTNNNLLMLNHPIYEQKISFHLCCFSY